MLSIERLLPMLASARDTTAVLEDSGPLLPPSKVRECGPRLP